MLFFPCSSELGYGLLDTRLSLPTQRFSHHVLVEPADLIISFNYVPLTHSTEMVNSLSPLIWYINLTRLLLNTPSKIMQKFVQFLYMGSISWYSTKISKPTTC